MFTTIVTKECFNEIEYCRGFERYDLSKDCNRYHQCDREGWDETDCDANLNEYWPGCGKLISELKEYDSDWDDE